MLPTFRKERGKAFRKNMSIASVILGSQQATSQTYNTTHATSVRPAMPSTVSARGQQTVQQCAKSSSDETIPSVGLDFSFPSCFPKQYSPFKDTQKFAGSFSKQCRPQTPSSAILLLTRYGLTSDRFKILGSFQPRDLEHAVSRTCRTCASIPSLANS